MQFSKWCGCAKLFKEMKDAQKELESANGAYEWSSNGNRVASTFRCEDYYSKHEKARKEYEKCSTSLVNILFCPPSNDRIKTPMEEELTERLRSNEKRANNNSCK